jgi:hypothetical protein
MSLPEWFLPPLIVLKTLKPECLEEFENEKSAYARLKALQGCYISNCYGEVNWNGTRCLLLSEIGGYALDDPQAPKIEAWKLKAMLEEAVREVTRYHVEPPEPKLDHFHVIDNHRVMMLDFEGASSMEPEDAEFLYGVTCRETLRLYANHHSFQSTSTKFRVI